MRIVPKANRRSEALVQLEVNFSDWLLINYLFVYEVDKRLKDQRLHPN